MKKFLKILIILALIIIYTYILAIQSLPTSITILEGEDLNLKTILGLNLKVEKTIETASSEENPINENSNKTVKVSLFDNIFVKNINVDVIEKTTVIPVGTLAGIKLYTNGVLVVGMSEIEGTDSKRYKPYENSGIKEGDTIIAINQKHIESTEELIKEVNNSKGESLNIKYLHDLKTQECSITPVKTDNTGYKLGLWVRDSAAGIGTVTYYEPQSKSFAALGHGITDIDTEGLINISSGEFVTTRILNVIKGEEGKPGKIQGTVEQQKNIGTIYKNTQFGVYGEVENISSLNINMSKQMEVCLRDEIKQGKATILCSVDKENKVEEFEIEIEKIYKENNYNNKSMLIKITDQRLLEKTGGIIQGMSGAPIIQNGKFIGAVTHVLVNKPTEGYAIFGDLMIKQMKQAK